MLSAQTCQKNISIKSHIAFQLKNSTHASYLDRTFELFKNQEGTVIMNKTGAIQLEWVVESPVISNLFVQVCDKFTDWGLASVGQNVHYGVTQSSTSMYKYIGKLDDLEEYQEWSQTYPRFMRQEYLQKIEEFEHKLEQLYQTRDQQIRDLKCEIDMLQLDMRKMNEAMMDIIRPDSEDFHALASSSTASKDWADKPTWSQDDSRHISNK